MKQADQSSTMVREDKSQVKQNGAILRVLQNASPKLRKAILKEAGKSVVFAICELCDNLLAGNVPLSTKQKANLKKYTNILRSLSLRGQGWKTKKQILSRSGGSFLPVLISIIASALGPQLFS